MQEKLPGEWKRKRQKANTLSTKNQLCMLMPVRSPVPCSDTQRVRKIFRHIGSHTECDTRRARKICRPHQIPYRVYRQKAIALHSAALQSTSHEREIAQWESSLNHGGCWWMRLWCAQFRMREAAQPDELFRSVPKTGCASSAPNPG